MKALLQAGHRVRVSAPLGKRFLISLILTILSVTARPAWAHGDYEEIVLALREQLKTNPDSAQLVYQLALAHAEHEEAGPLKEAIVRLEQVAPGQYDIAYLRGLALSFEQQYREAFLNLKSFTLEHPDHAPAFAALASVQMKLGDPAGAAESYQESIRLKPPFVPRLYCDWALALHADKQPEQSVRVVEKGLAALGQDQELLQTGYRIARASALWQSALDFIDGLQALAPAPEPWRAERAELLGLTGRREEARACWVTLLDHLNAMPSLKRGTPQNRGLINRARQALGQPVVRPAVASPVIADKPVAQPEKE